MSNLKAQDEAIIQKALTRQKESTTNYNNSINECLSEKITTALQDIQFEEYEILKKMKNQMLKRNILSTQPAEQEKIDELIRKFSK